MRRWLRFNLRTLFLVVTLSCVVIGTWLHRSEKQRQAVAAIRARGGTVFYSYEWRDDTYVRDAKSPAPDFLLDQLGVDMFHRVVAVEMGAYFQLDVYDVWPGETTFDSRFSR